MRRPHSRAVAGLVALGLVLAAGGCPRPDAPAGLGKRLAAGPVLAVRASADGEWLAYLDGCAPVQRRGVPVRTASCDLEVIPAAGGPPQRVARGVTSLPGGFAWSAEGHVLAASEDHDLNLGEGSLVTWVPGGPPRRLGEGVTFWAFARQGWLLGFVWRGQVHLWRPGAEAEPVPGADRVATFELHPRGEAGVPLLLCRRHLSSGGELLAVTPGRTPVRAGGPAGDYAFSPAGDRFAFTERSGEFYDLHLASSAAPAAKGPALGEGVGAMAFSRDGAGLAFIAGVAPGKQGDLWVATGAARPVRVAQAVGELRWATGAARLAWLEGFDARVRSGAVALGAPGERPAPLAKNVSAFEISPGGDAVAFLEHSSQGGYSVDLKIGRGGAATSVARGVFGFDFAPGGAEVWYRTSCARNAEACDLWAAPVAEPAKARKIADGVKSFEFDRRRSGRVLLGWARQDRVALDLAVWDQGRLTAVDKSAVPGTAVFLAPDSRRLAYAVNDPKRQGLYLAEVP